MPEGCLLGGNYDVGTVSPQFACVNLQRVPQTPELSGRQPQRFSKSNAGLKQFAALIWRYPTLDSPTRRTTCLTVRRPSQCCALSDPSAFRSGCRQLIRIGREERADPRGTGPDGAAQKQSVRKRIRHLFRSEVSQLQRRRPLRAGERRSLSVFRSCPVVSIRAADEGVGFFVAGDLFFLRVERQRAAQSRGDVAKVTERC